MDSENRNNLVINGAGKASGGKYKKVEINGSGKIEDHLDCIDFITNGKSEVNGDVKTDRVEVNGFAAVNGHTETKRLKVSGKANMGGNISGDEVIIEGHVTAKGDCEAETFRLKGGFSLDGLLNAGNIDIQLYGNCRVKEIGGEIINVREGHQDFRNFIKMFFQSFATKLTTDTIEGDDIHLDYTTANVVRGNNITIGPGCDIDLVEYQGTYHQHEEAKVHDCKKI